MLNVRVRGIYNFIKRIMGEEHCDKFKIVLLSQSEYPQEYFEICSKIDKIEVKGSTLSAITSGIYWYMKYYCKVQWTWCGSQMNMPKSLPKLEKPILKRTSFEWRYYLNYCTHSYSMAFWDWERWEQEIDWMAMNGINLVLSLTGIEEVWRRFLIKLGYTDDEARNYICGPGYFAWQWMGNMTSFGGPLPPKWFEDRIELAKKIHGRMSELGITPILQGYSGMLPIDYKSKHEGVEIMDQGLWNGFERPGILLPTSSQFKTIASIFYEEQKGVYGDITHYYSTDPFHEGGKVDGLDLGICGKRIQDEMIKFDPQAIWILQGWEPNPRKSVLDAIDKNHIIVLNLLGGRKPLWKTSEGFHGSPWLWCTIQNYGGRSGLYGFLDILAREPFEALQSEYGSNMKGIGLAPEGIETNPVSYEILCDLVWRDTAPNVSSWLASYSERRYGKRLEKAVQAWELLHQTVYNSYVVQPGAVESPICARPKLGIQNVSTWGPKGIDYDVSALEQAFLLMLDCYEEAKESEGYQYDLVDIGRQVLSNRGRFLNDCLLYAYEQKDLEGLKKRGQQFLDLILMQDQLLSTRKEFLLGRWLEDAKKLGQAYDCEELFEFNARAQITTWGGEDSAETLHEYGCKEWAGLTGDLYYRRWQIFLENLYKEANSDSTQKLELGREWHEDSQKETNVTKFNWFEVENQWVNESNQYSNEAINGLYEILLELKKLL